METQKSLSFYRNLSFLEIFAHLERLAFGGEAGFWERRRTREADGEDGPDQEVMLEGISNSKSHGQR